MSRLSVLLVLTCGIALPFPADAQVPNSPVEATANAPGTNAPGNSAQLNGAQTNGADATGNAETPPTPSTGIPVNNVSEPALTVEQIDELVQQVDGLAEADTEVKPKAKAIYAEARQLLETANQARARAATYQSKIESIESEVAAARQRREKLPDDPTDVITRRSRDEAQTLELSALEKQVEQLRKAVTTAEKEVSQLQAEPDRRAARSTEIPDEIKNAEKELTDLQAQLIAETNQDTSIVAVATRTRQKAKIQQLKAQIEAIRLEGEYYSESSELLRLQTDIAARQAAQLRSRLDAFANALQLRKSETARKRQAEAEEDAAAYEHPQLRSLANRNAELAAELQELIEANREADALKSKIQSELNEIETKLNSTKNIVETVGLTPWLGQELRRQKLPDLRQIHQDIRQLNESTFGPENVDFRKQQYDISNTRDDLSVLTDELQQIDESVRPEGRQLYEDRIEVLDELLEENKKFQRDLLTINFDEQQLAELTEEFENFIASRLFWIRSDEPIGLRTAPLAWSTAKQILTWSSLRAAGSLLWQDFRRSWWIWPLALAFVVLAARRRYYRDQIVRYGEIAARRGTSEFEPTLRALLATLLISLPWPGLLWFFGWRIQQAAEQVVDAGDAMTLLVQATGVGCQKTAIAFFFLEFVRQMLRKYGLAEAHFAWPDEAARLPRVQMRWMMILVLPLLLVYSTGISFGERSGDDWDVRHLARLGFIGMMLLISIFLQRILAPNNRLYDQLIARDENAWAHRLRWLWYPTVVAGPLLLIGLTSIGYFETARQLATRVLNSVLILTLLGLIGATTSRWVIMSRRRIAMVQARQRWAAINQAESTPAGSKPQGNEDIDLASLSEQTRKLIYVSLTVAGAVAGWLIWYDVVPALALLREVNLGPVSLLSLLMSAACLVITFAATRNIPGLLELMLLRHLPLDAGARYAITTCTRYLIVAAGLIAAGQAINITWDSIQWLIAALGIGLGFGLQEIVANFVSGIIVLFERPLRIGDIVTLGDTTGTVTRINIRATTVTDWDRKEYVVPNKDLITGRLLNWTLTESISRIVINVGVAYGSDTSLAQQLLIRCARENQYVLDDPPPIATFEGFGDSTLDLVLRCYLPNLDNLLTAKSELFTAIDLAFRTANIEIAFPQRDLHFRSSDVRFRILAENAANPTNGHSTSNSAPESLPTKPPLSKNH